MFAEEIQSISIFSSNNAQYVFDTDSNHTMLDISQYDDAIKNARQAKGKEVWSYSNQNEILLIRTINNRNTANEIGIMIIKLRKSFLENVFSSHLNDMQNIILFDDEDNIIFSLTELEHASVKLLLNNIKDSNGMITDKNTKDLIFNKTVPVTKWQLIIINSAKRFYSDSHMLRNMYLLIYLLTFVVIYCFSKNFTKRMLIPINDLIYSAKAFKEKNQIITVSVSQSDEFGYLSECFNDMALHIEDMIHTRYIEHVLRNEAQIKALQAQINPHFIFNTLDTITWMIRMKKNDIAVEMISILAELMEVNAGKISNLIPLESEIEYIENYCSMLKYRYNDKIRIKYAIESDISDIIVPSLILQPIVENAASHGIAKTDRIGVISISIYKHINENCLIIDVVDNGIGIDEETLTFLNETLATDNDTYFRNVSSKKTGLENVNRRVKFFCGDIYGLKISSMKGHYCKVTCRLPLDITAKNM